MRTVLFVAVAFMLFACGVAPPPPMKLQPDVVRSTQRYSRQYVLQPGDQVEVTVFHIPELSRTVTVRPDGFISLPLLKDVKAAGMTVPELDDDLARRYQPRVVNPEVTVTVLNPSQASIYVLGEVPRPGPVAVRDAHTVAQAIGSAGGALRTASLENVAVIRLEDDGTLAGYIIKREKLGDTAFYMAMSTMILKNGDLVIVPESGRSQFVRFVQDFVNTPLSGVTQVLTPYIQVETLRLIQKASH